MWHTKDIQEVRRRLKTDIGKGLTKGEVEQRRIQYGENKLQEKKKESLWIRFLKQFNDFMILILIGASILSAIIEKVSGSGDYVDSIIIIGIVVFNAIMGLVQEAKAEKSIEALKNMAAPVAKVRRNGKIETVKGTEVVPGDIVLLEAGNYVPADCRLIETSNLKIEESSLTGETIPVIKQADAILTKDSALGDRTNMAFATTIVVNGHGSGIVTDIGMQTKVGQIAKMILEDEAPETPLQKKMGQIGKTLGMACLVICVCIFIIGLLKKIPAMEMFMTSVGLAVAAIPEGLPAIITIMLSIGVTKMAKRNTIIRKLPAVETLGSSSVICSDKTGTLTQNKMQVTKIETVDQEKQTQEFALELGAMCNDVEVQYKGKIPILAGEATESAILDKAIASGKDKEALYEKMPRLQDIPFESERKMMTTIHRLGPGYRMITKGAPDILLQRCNRYQKNGRVEYISSGIINKIEKQNTTMASQALRVLAIAYSDVESLPNEIHSETIENNLIFVGLIGMIDPPREGVKEAVATCKKAGIKTVMITGDHIDTAKAIAKELGILTPHTKCMTGKELDKMSKEALERSIEDYRVFARVNPEHKVRIVKAFQSTGGVVAMTGDGVNDAPALKNADIGIAMGKNGTDVAKNAADMILTDDNFVTIVEAVKQGRTIFSNIRKAIHFLLATNIGEIVAIFMGLVLGWSAPLLAIQLLWINLITDSLPAIALGLEKSEKDSMHKPPIDAKKGIFHGGLWGQIMVEGTMIGMLTLFAFCIGNSHFGLEVGRSMAFVTLGMLELVHSFNIKSRTQSIFSKETFNNPYLLGAFALGSILQVGVIAIPFLAQIFEVVPLNTVQWLYVLGISVLPIVVMELQKKCNEKKFGKTIYDWKEHKEAIIIDKVS